ncbi:MAG: 4Fe-4S binding protein [Anaerolineaceae bacterium]|nr:4Fe-4S binding protein [Anaerolineaceae bacterium]
MTDLTQYKALAQRLDDLPQGFPPTEDGSELRMLAYLFTPEEAALGAQLRMTLEKPAEIAERLDMEMREVAGLLKSMAKKGLIKVGGIPRGGLGFGLLPFVVGIYEMQAGRIDKEFAQLFEDYYQKTRAAVVEIQPPFHRVIPVGEAITVDMSVQPYMNAAELVKSMSSWGVSECICRNQRALLDEGCDHPLEVCMVLSEKENAFPGSDSIRKLSKEEALDVLKIAADAGLVHSISNHKDGHWYLCNCCTCSCAIMRGMKELGIADVVAKSPYVAEIDQENCISCEICIERCPFDAIDSNGSVLVNMQKCAGCGQCVLVCPQDAIAMKNRANDDVGVLYKTEEEWLAARAASRKIDLSNVM